MFRTLEGSKFKAMSIVTAVITGDIINSTEIVGDYKGVLHRIGDDIKDHIDHDFLIDVYRGDSFQTISKKPEKGLLILLLIKSGLKTYSNKKGNENIQWDARMSLGIGRLERYPPSMNLKEFTGEPFVNSGRAFDKIKDSDQEIAITTGIERLDEEINAVLPMIEVITQRWTTAQSETIYQLLLEPKTQDKIGEKFGLSQRAIGKRLEASKIESLRPYISRFDRQICTYKI